ncbi:MAG: tannase/feruloyl esterase family alpha/beta hydrolase [Acidobacteria bacterium]|nr:tannase/feruloyl esterase family alpha/beta hydrolase [Acidobacteriota bacterium]
MKQGKYALRHGVVSFALLLAGGLLSAALGADEALLEKERACQALADTPNLTITSARLKEASGSIPAYCYVKGIISQAIQYHIQLPLPEKWNGRYVTLGDGGKDGDLDFADGHVAQGYAVANSNTGHDNGSEPGASFGFNNRQAEIDFGYRAVHLTTNAAKTLVQAYYGKEPQYSYFDGCSTGGRQGLMEAQRFPYDFDGIVAGAPVYRYQENSAAHVWILQRIFKENFARNLAFDTNGDKIPDSLTKATMLQEAVLAKCDAIDGIKDGVIDDPLSCKFDPAVDLASKMCRGNVNADNCFTAGQIEMIRDIYGGARDSKGVRINNGRAFGSEFGWPTYIVAHAGNSLSPSNLGTSGDHMNYLFYETDPGVPVADPTNVSYVPNKKKKPPEWAWWEFNIDDVTSGKGNFMMEITDAKDPDLRPFLLQNGGKLILYHGWADPTAVPKTTLDYFNEVVAATFKGDPKAAQEHVRLFMIPGMAHCGGGPGPNAWDKLKPLVDWVENGKAPDFVVATRTTNGRVDNERKVCPYPQRAVYTGPAGGQDNPVNWVQGNFACR